MAASSEGRLQVFCSRRLFMPAFQACSMRLPVSWKPAWREVASMTRGVTSTMASQMRSTRCRVCAGITPQRVCRNLSNALPGIQVLRPSTGRPGAFLA
jgi:hypothetical protein